MYVNEKWFRIYSTFMHDDISPLIFDSFYQGGKMRGKALGEWKPIHPNQISNELFFPKIHGMARANLKKLNTYKLLLPHHQSKYIPKRHRICINWNPTFQTQIYLVKIPLDVNIVKQDLLNKKQLLKILRSDVWKEGFQLIQILGLLSLYFDAVVVEVKTFLLLFWLALAILCIVIW